MKKRPKAYRHKELINFEEFTKLDLRVGTIIAAEKSQKTKKLFTASS